MDFPTELLPKENYKTIDCDISKCILVRIVKIIEEFPLINPDTGNIQLKYIADPTKQIADYSTNLLGVFEMQHLDIALTENGKLKYNHYCNPNEIVDTPIFQTDFDNNKVEKYFTLLISELNNYEIPYENGNEKYKGVCSIEHTPMKWNFWHFSIRWKNVDKEYLHLQNENKLKRGWARQLSSAAKSLIVQFARLNEPNYFVIPKNCYTKLEA